MFSRKKLIMSWFKRKKEDRYSKTYYKPLVELRKPIIIDHEMERVEIIQKLYANGNLSAAEAIKAMRVESIKKQTAEIDGQQIQTN